MSTLRSIAQICSTLLLFTTQRSQTASRSSLSSTLTWSSGETEDTNYQGGKINVFRIDFTELFDMFEEFSETEMIGIGADLTPTYFEVTEQYRLQDQISNSLSKLTHFQKETSQLSCGCSRQKSGRVKWSFRLQYFLLFLGF